MLKAFIASLVLAIAVGPSAGLVCKGFCRQETPTPSACHHNADSNTAPKLSDGATCDDGPANSVAVLADGTRRAVSVTAADSALMVQRWQFVLPTTGRRLDRARGPLPALETRPLETSLRI